MNKKNPAFLAKEKMVRFLKSRTYPVIPVSDTMTKPDTEAATAKDAFINQLKKSIKGPCIFVHFPEEDSTHAI